MRMWQLPSVVTARSCTAPVMWWEQAPSCWASTPGGWAFSPVSTATGSTSSSSWWPGFLASMEPDQIGEIARLQTGDYRVSKRMLLRGKVLDKTGTCLRELTALNDIVISRNFSRVIEFTVSRNNVVLGEYRADGVIFSTPTGSTAYALSAGGPIIEPEFSCIEMNLICPHSLSARPILFSPHNDLQVSLRVREEYDAYFCADGEKPEPFPEGRVMEISGSDQSLEILDLSGNTFFDSLSRKLMQSLKSGRS